jgi:nitrite reductase (NO-forming)
MKTNKKIFGSSVLTAVVALLMVGPAHTSSACDACNLAFAKEVLNERADSSIGRDMRRAMENQKNLKLEGHSNPALQSAQRDILKSATISDSSTAEPVQSPNTASRAQPIPVESSLSTEAIGEARPFPDYLANAPFADVLKRDYALDTTPYSTVPQDTPADRSFTISMSEGSVYIGNGVVYEGFTMDDKIPGTTIIVDEGDVVEMSFKNDGKIPHGASIHAAYTQTSKYVGSIGPGETKSVRFRAMTPGVYMYHCAPGGHAIGMHVIGGQYGMIVVRPKPGSYQLERELGHAPNIELYLIQHELYATGKDAIKGNPDYVLFNGRTFRYVEEPILANPGDYVRINFLNVGPNILSTFHIVGIIWDYVYWQGHPDAKLPGGQSVTAGPTDSFVIEFRMPPDEGAYTMLSHVVGSTNRGAIGLIVVDGDAELEPHRVIMADGPAFNQAEMRGYLADAKRIISPYGIGTHPEDRPVVFGPETKEVFVSIIGNSYYPKVIQVAPGTKVTWTNEDAFTYMAGEYSGIHNAAATSVPEESDGFVSPLLAHGESWSHVFEEWEWEYTYICTPHPYMRGKVIVKNPDYALGASAGASRAEMGPWILPLLGLCLLLATASLALRRNAKA